MASTIIAGALIATAASAQETATQSAPAAEAGVTPAESGTNAETTTGEIVVTGSLIRNPNLTSASPVNTFAESEITLRAPNTAEELLRQLPGVSPGIGSQVNNGANGTNSVDLRGLGVQRNLVLLDGNRLVPTLANGAVDLNNIPLALIQRVDVLTGGASTTYGADAVSGVVNFITRRDFTGIDMRANYKIPQRGSGRSYRIDLTLGSNFADDRGNAVISLGYTNVDPVYQTRPFALFGVNSVPNQSSSGSASGSSFTAVPTTISFPTADLQVSPDNSSLIPQYAGFNFNPYNIFQTPLERKSLYGAARYDVTDSVEVYARGTVTQSTIQQIIAPSGIFGVGQTINAGNPYLNATVRNQICAQNFASQSALAASATDPRVAAFYTADAARYAPAACAAQNGGTATIAPTVNAAGTQTAAGTLGTGLALPAVYRRLVELGPRISNWENNTYDARAGARWSINSSLSLDVSGSYGRSEQTQTQSGYVLNSRVGQALIANSTTACSNTANGCVPLNLFGQAGSISPATVAFLQGQSTTRINTELKQAKAVLQGDFGGYTVPFASKPINFAVGAEYRRYTYERIPDAFAQNPSELGGAGGAILPFSGGYEVKEAFGELIAPIVSDKPFMRDITLEGGIRYSEYNIQAAGNPKFNTTTYKGAATWEVADGFKFRGNYQRAVRAPNIGELFSPTSTGLTSLTVDPCAGAAPTTNANLAAVCRAQGAPANTIGSIQNPSASQANGTFVYSTNIKPEKADTYTLGVVITPSRFVPGLSFSVDYYNITIRDAITFLTPGDAINACFGNITAASATSAACTSIVRSPANGRLSGDSGIVKGLLLPETNNGRIKTSGVDLVADYKRTFGQFGLNLNFTGNWTNSLRFRAAPSSLDRQCVGYYSANCGVSNGQIQPRYSFNQRTTLTYGPANVSLLWRYIGASHYEPGLTPLYSGAIRNGSGVSYVYAGQNYNPNRIKPFSYFDFNTQFDVTKTLQLTLTVTNLLDKDPPLVGAGAGTTAANSGNTFPSTYDPIGRTFSVTARVKL